MQSNRSSIHNLPNEIVEQIIYCLDGVLFLHALMTVYSPSTANYQEGTEATLFAVIRNSTLAPQFQRILCTTLCVRQYCPHSDIDYEWSLGPFQFPSREQIYRILFLMHVHVYSRMNLWH